MLRGTLKCCDLLDGALAGVVELLSKGELLSVELGSATALATASACCSQSVAGVRDDEFALPTRVFDMVRVRKRGLLHVGLSGVGK